jgi:zinc protease
MKRTILIIALFFTLPQFILAQEMVLLKKPVSNKIVVKFMFQNGSIADPVGKEGLTALTASLIREGGTQKYTRAEIDNKIYPMAARYWASVDKEVSVFTFEFPVQYQQEFHEIMMGLMLNPSFVEEDFNRVKSNQLNYVEQVIKASSDEDFSKMVLEEMLFVGTPYSHMKAGTVEGVKSITLEDVKNHYRQFFSHQNLMIGIAGKFNDAYAEAIKNEMQKLPAQQVNLPEIAKPKNPDGIQVKIVQKDDALGSAIYAGFPINITRADDDFVALMVANSWLGEHRKSYGRLFQELREKRSMNYGTYSYIEWYERGSSNQLPPSGVPRSMNYFSLWVRPVQTGESLRQQYDELKNINTGHAHFALRLALLELEDLIKNGLTEQDFQRTKNFLKNYTKLYIQTPGSELGFLMDSKFYNRTDFIKEVGEKLETLTLEEVNAAVRKHLQVENMHVAVITHNSEANPLAQGLKQNTVSPMSYSNIVKAGLPQSVLDKDRRAASFKLNVRNTEIVSGKEMFLK